MIRFNNDYSKGCHERVLEYMEKYNGEAYGGYGLDPWCEKAANKIKEYIKNENADIHFLVGGTQTNFIALASMLRPYQSVISANTGHIHVHETGAVENSGHKVHTLEAVEGKINAKQIEEEILLFEESPIKEHITMPKAVYISFPTEYGTVYSKAELEEIYSVCKKHNLYLFIDGARLGYGLAASEMDISDIAKNCDMFYIGGTKCGALFGEALIILNDALKEDFRSYIKQNGAMLAKGWLLGIQFYALMENGLYFEITKKAVTLAQRIKEAFNKKGIPSFIDSPTNQQFVILENTQMDILAKNYIFEFDRKIDETHTSVRFCTAWYTDEKDVDELMKDIERL